MLDDWRGHRTRLGLALRRLRIVIPLLVASLAAPHATLADAPQNDAGLGGDAGDARATATPLPAHGARSGELRALDDDWYTMVRSPGLACVWMDASGDTYANATLAVRSGAETYGVRAPLAANATTRLAVAGSAVAQSWFGFERLPNPAGNDAARPRFYAFATAESGVPQSDGGMAGDAGGTLAGASAISGGCSGGRLAPMMGLGDMADVYSFALAQPGQVVYSMGASVPVRVELVDASGAAAGPALVGDGIATAQVPAGTYYLRVAAVDGTEVVSYVLALLGPDPPPGSPCRPHCMLTG